MLVTMGLETVKAVKENLLAKGMCKKERRYGRRTGGIWVHG